MLCMYNCLILPLSGSVHATSIAASRVEQALSEVASSLQSSAPKHGPLHPWMTLAQIWLHAGMSMHIQIHIQYMKAQQIMILLYFCDL